MVQRFARNQRYERLPNEEKQHDGQEHESVFILAVLSKGLLVKEYQPFSSILAFHHHVYNIATMYRIYCRTRHKSRDWQSSCYTKLFNASNPI